MSPTFLKSLQALDLAVRTGSLKAAAEQLSITPAAVGQRIKTLEDHLGLDLLARGGSGIRPTRELSAAIAHISAGFRELETAASILDFQRVHEIHIIADTDWAELWLKPRIAGFKAENPNILFCINGVGDVPLRLGHADCEVWLGGSRGERDEDEMFRDYLVPIGSPDNVKRFWETESRLEGFPLLHLDCYRSDPVAIGWPEWVRTHGNRKTALERGMRYANLVRALEAIYADAGFLICGLGLIEEEVRIGRLRLPFPVAQGAWTSHAYRVVFRSSAARRAQVVRFRSWLLERSSETRAQLRQQVAGT